MSEAPKPGEVTDCFRCGGTGKAYQGPCNHCAGLGKLRWVLYGYSEPATPITFPIPTCHQA